MKISRNWLQTYFNKEIPEADKLAELFTFHAFEVEGVEEVEKTNESKEDTVLDVKVLPDRAHYALSHRGIAGEVSALTGMEINERYVGPIEANIADMPDIKIENPDFCRRYIARTISIGKVGIESPIWLKNALGSIGQRSINPIVDITNYVMYDIGQPLHAFDADKVKGGLTVRPAREGEKIVLLDGREILLTAEDSVIADEEGALVIAGAKGGKRAEISETTTKIIIESANFHPTKVRRTSTKYDIRSDSSKRFENEITPEMAIHGMNNVSGLIKEMIPEAKFGPVADNYPNKVVQTTFDFDPAYIEGRLGVTIPIEKIKNILQSLNVVVSGCLSSQDLWNLIIPYERLDLANREDIVEEVGRVYGYDKVVGILPPGGGRETSPGQILPDFFVAEKIKSTLIGLGYSEVSLYSLVHEGYVETAKPLARDKAFARNNLSKGMIACVERNVLNADLLGLNTVKVFEIGRIFTEDAEKVHLVLGVSIVKKIKGVKAENIIDEALKVIEKELGVEIKGKAMTNKMGNVCVLEIDLEPVIKSSKAEIRANNLGLESVSTNRYTRFSLYPFIVRDIAVFVPESVSSEKVWGTIEVGILSANARDLLARHSLFDTFKKDGRTSYALRMIFQSMEKTLTDEEINSVMDSINVLIKKERWEVR